MLLLGLFRRTAPTKPINLSPSPFAVGMTAQVQDKLHPHQNITAIIGQAGKTIAYATSPLTAAVFVQNVSNCYQLYTHRNKLQLMCMAIAAQRNELLSVTKELKTALETTLRRGSTVMAGYYDGELEHAHSVISRVEHAMKGPQS